MTGVQGDLTAERLREVLAYDPDTGMFTWRVNTSHRSVIGTEAGHLKKNKGYRYISVGGYKTSAHRLAWLYVHGSWPTHEIDHINGQKHDNRISNLRDVERRLNRANTAKALSNTSGYKGVGKRKVGKKWFAQIGCKIRGHRHLGYFHTKEEAAAAYDAAALETFGECAKLNFPTAPVSSAQRTQSS